MKLNATSDLPQQAQTLLVQLLPNSDVVPPMVGEALFVDIDGDSELELVATVDYSGREFYDNVVLVQRKDNRFVWSEVVGNGISITSLSAHLVDVDGNGSIELIIENYIDHYEGAQPAPKETLIYEWEDGHFVDNSDAFPSYYRLHVVPRLERALNKLTGGSSSPSSDDNGEVRIITTQLERAKRRAGLE